MNIVSKYIGVALLGIAFLSACNRHIAYFQPSQAQRFHTTKTGKVAVVPTAELVQPIVAETLAMEVVAVTLEIPPAAQVVQAKAAVSQVDAYVRNDSKLALNKKLAKRLARVNEMVTTVETKLTVDNTAILVKKMSLAERMVLKRLNKKIKNYVAPEEVKEMNRTVRVGLIVTIVGLLVWILGAFSGSSVLLAIGVLGFIAFFVGLVLVLVGLLNQ